MNKRHIVDIVIRQLEVRFETLGAASNSARAEATHEELHAESKYDTRGLEAGYLANGQAQQAEEVAWAVADFRDLAIREFDDDTPIALSALVELEMDGERSLYFLGPAAGGLEIEVDDRKLTLLTPEAPLVRQLLGRKVGDTIARPAGKILRVE